MKLLENDVAIITILTLLLFSLVKFQEATADNTVACENHASQAVERTP